MHAEANHRNNSVGLAALPGRALDGRRASRSNRSLVRGSGGSYRDGVPLWPRTGVAGRRAQHAADSTHLRSASALGAHATERTQEFTLCYRGLGGSAVKEIVRQQWNFSPAGSTSETEDYQVDLHRVSMLELWLEPDQGHGLALAGLAEWRLA